MSSRELEQAQHLGWLLGCWRLAAAAAKPPPQPPQVLLIAFFEGFGLCLVYALGCPVLSSYNLLSPGPLAQLHPPSLCIPARHQHPSKAVLRLLLLLHPSMLLLPAGVGYMAYGMMHNGPEFLNKRTAVGLADPVCDPQHYATMAAAFMEQHPEAMFAQVGAGGLGWGLHGHACLGGARKGLGLCLHGPFCSGWGWACAPRPPRCLVEAQPGAALPA